MSIRNKKIQGITFVEVMVASLLLIVILLPVFNFLTKSVRDTEKIYAECVAITRIKQVMDTMLLQLPWRTIRVDNSDRSRCYFKVPDITDDDSSVEKAKKTNEENLLKKIIPQIFGDGCEQGGKLWGDGIYRSEKGFLFRTRAKVVDLDQDYLGSQDITLYVSGMPSPDGDGQGFHFNKITNRDADGKYNLVKKIIVQIKWSLKKGLDPKLDPNARTMFLVGFKSNLEG